MVLQNDNYLNMFVSPEKPKGQPVWFYYNYLKCASGIGVPGLGSFLSFLVIRLECKGRTGYPTYNPTLGRLLGLQAFPRLIFSLLHLVDI